MEQREELEIETRLRAALTARSELVTHSTLRPGIPPNEHTAGLKTKRAGLWSWRRFLVPATVAAALAGGVFVGAQLPDDKDKGIHAGAAPTPDSTSSVTGAANTQATQPSAQGAPSSQSAVTPAAETSVAALSFTLADGWQVAPIDASSACVTPKAKAAAGSSGATSAGGNAAAAPAGLPCGVDALYLKSGAAPDAWPRSTATKATGWWPKPVDAATDLTCPTAKPGSANKVQDSVPLRSSAKYALGGGNAAAAGSGVQTAVYHEWAVTCDEGSGVRPMLWELVPSGAAAGDTKAAVVTVVSSDPAYDAALLGMVGTLHLAG